MSKTVKFIQLSKTITLVTKTPYGWFYSQGKSIKHLHNSIHNTLSIVIPDADCHLQIKLSGTQFKNEATLLKLYSKACIKFNIKNIFQHYTIVTPDGGYWHGTDHEPSTLSQNANPTDWGTKEEAEIELAEAIAFCKKAGWYAESFDYKVEDFSLAKYGE